MAYDIQNPPSLITQGIGGGVALRRFEWVGTDTVDAVTAPGYVENAESLGIQLGDIVLYKALDGDTFTAHALIVDDIDPDGRVTLGLADPFSVKGPSNATANNLAVFDGEKGNLIKDAGVGASDFALASVPRAQAMAKAIPAGVTSIQTNGYATPGDGGAALYKKVGAEPAHDLKFQSTDGAWWEFSSDTLPAAAGGVFRAAQPSGVPLPALNYSRLQGEFRVSDYLRSVDMATAEAVEAGSVIDQNGDKVLAAVRAAGDDMLAYVRGGSLRGGVLQFPAGQIGFKDEMFSDAFQEAYWSQAGIGKGRHMVVRGAGADATTLQVRSDYISSVRNTANGNQRTYGPWAGSPSPSILISGMADTAAGAPCAMSLQGLLLRGNHIIGSDPIAWFVTNELDARHSDIHARQFSNHGQVINGSYNSMHLTEHFEGCGLQPVEGGSIMGYAAGFPPPYVRFDFTTSGTTVSVTAKAAYAADGYGAGDTVPFFNSSHIGKKFRMVSIASFGGQYRAATLTITAVGGSGSPTATMTAPSGFTLRPSALLAQGSFGTLRFSVSASSDLVTFSDKVKLGRGAQDMLGHMVSLVKAGASGHIDHSNRNALDVMTSRIKTLSGGDDATGYTQATMTSAARLAVTTDLALFGVGHTTAMEETIFTSVGSPLDFTVNDTDFVMCRWEFSGGYGTDPQTGACMFLAQGQTGSVNYVACKAHGADIVRGNFGSDAQFILDGIENTSFTGFSFTHSSLEEKGQVRIMGKECRDIRLTDIQLGSWQQPVGWAGFYLDPAADANLANWRIMMSGIGWSDTTFAGSPGGRELIAASSLINKATLARIIGDRPDRMPWVITDADNLDDFVWPGTFIFSNSVPANAPPFTNFAVLEVQRYDAFRIMQVIRSIPSNSQFQRGYNSTWGKFKEIGVADTATTAQLADVTSDVNTKNKRAGKVVINTSTGALYAAAASTAVGTWHVYNRDSTVIPA